MAQNQTELERTGLGTQANARMKTTDSILEYNRGRNPALLAVKWERMRGDAFAFFRGSAPLFYEAWSKVCPKGAPLAWITGDAHPENLGSYRGANRVPYFDLNDFDECCLAPASWEVGRALASLLILRRSDMARRFLSAYAQILAGGKPQHIEPEVAEGPIADLLARVAGRRRRDFLKKWVPDGRLRMRTGRSYRLGGAGKARARRVFNAWARGHPERSRYRVLDICGRVAGNGSLGLERYIVLVKGKHQPVILDIKAAAQSAPLRYLLVRQPRWRSEAERVATVQHYMQYVPIARLSWTRLAGQSYVVHELQPIDDRITVAELSDSDYEEFIRQWAGLVASSQLRTAGWNGSADLDALMTYGRSLTSSARKELLSAASTAASVQRMAWVEFKRSFPGRGTGRAGFGTV